MIAVELFLVVAATVAVVVVVVAVAMEALSGAEAPGTPEQSPRGFQ